MSESEQLDIEILTRYTGAIIHNLDLSQPLTTDQIYALEQALYKYHVLFFRNQHLTVEQQRDFALQFGPMHVHAMTLNTTSPWPEITNIEFDPKINLIKETRQPKWHTDLSWLPNPPTIGMLYAKIIPKQGGGDTLWANMQEIYKQELSDQMKEILSNLTAEHSMETAWKPQNTANSELMEMHLKIKETNPPVNHPVICEHPHTKEKYIYVNYLYTTKINELNKEESDLLLQYLFSLVNKGPELTCRWKWSENDVCLWDERSTQHRGTRDFWPHHRQLHRCVITEREN